MRAVIAIRVSPRPAENVRYSPELQEDQCRDWCLRNGHEVVGVVSDILVSGGSRHRFDSILDAIDRLKPDLFVVADMSRWTRDTPTRYYAMKGILDDSGIRLVSVAEPFVGSDMPFSDTITTAVVESNLQQRLIANRKTSEGVRRAWAKGKRFGRALGWEWHPLERHDHDGIECAMRGEWTFDEATIRAFYEDWIANVSLTEMARRYGISAQNVTRAIRAKRQLDVVGAELWHRANQTVRGRAVRNDAKWGVLWSGLLGCPFCGRTLVQDGTTWGKYHCNNRWDGKHHWRSISARKYVLPVVRRVIEGTSLPEDEYISPERRVSPRRRSNDPSAELDRLSVAWSRGLLSTERYEKAVAEVQARVEVPPPPPRVEVVKDIRAVLPFLDCYRVCRHAPGTCPRDKKTAGIINRLLRELFERIEIGPDRVAEAHVREQYQQWVSR